MITSTLTHSELRYRRLFEAAHDGILIVDPATLMSIEQPKLEPDDVARRHRILETTAASCRRGADLVRRGLAFAQGRDSQRVAFRLQHLIDELKGIIGGTFPRTITVVTEIPADLWPILGDPTEIQQVLLNLAINARDAMPDGGTLTMTATNTTAGTVEAEAGQAPAARRLVLLTVADTGLGIPPEMRERIFEPFLTTKEPGKGTGLGLSTVHAVIKAHGGFANVESEIGRGTTFTIHLPAAPVPPRSAPVAPSTSGFPRGHNETVLVVDDESAIREITQQMLEALGYRVLTAGDGAAAIALYARESQQIALVLSDMMMPVMDGAATMQALRRLNPAVRIIAVSGLDSPENVARATHAGAGDFLAKPYTAQALARLVREVIDRSSAATAP